MESRADPIRRELVFGAVCGLGLSAIVWSLTLWPAEASTANMAALGLACMIGGLTLYPRRLGRISLELPAALGETVFVRVAATNAGGISFSSEVVGGRLAPSGRPDALVVAAFDRLDAGLLDEEYKHSSLGDVKVFVAATPIPLGPRR